MTIPKPMRSMKTVRNSARSDAFFIRARSLQCAPMRRRLVLFDIDGTLITDGGASRSAFADALRTVFGYDGDLRRYDFSGRTDPQIATMVLRDAGWTEEAVNAKLDELWPVYLAGLARNASAGSVRALPGIPSLVNALHAERSVTLGLLTGNIERGARLKL